MFTNPDSSCEHYTSSNNARRLTRKARQHKKCLPRSIIPNDDRIYCHPPSSSSGLEIYGTYCTLNMGYLLGRGMEDGSQPSFKCFMTCQTGGQRCDNRRHSSLIRNYSNARRRGLCVQNTASLYCNLYALCSRQAEYSLTYHSDRREMPVEATITQID